MAVIHILLAQLTVLWRNPAGNLEVLGEIVRKLEGGMGRILVLPEMVSTGFTGELEDVAELPGGHWECAFQRLVDQSELPTLLGIARKQTDQRVTNESVFLTPGGSPTEAPAYRKIRPFRSECNTVTPGHTVSTFLHQGIRFCPLICYDLRFPELFRAGLRQGAEVFLVIASWPARRQAHWELLLQARAVENQAYVIGVNRCGDDPNFHYAGGSMVVDPHGEILYHAGEEESVRAVEIDVASLRAWREEFPATLDYLGQPELR